jgi:DNA-binding NtrC family response regulator
MPHTAETERFVPDTRAGAEALRTAAFDQQLSPDRVASLLIIDDEPGIRQMLSYALSRDGFAVETAESGIAGVEALRRRKFDVAITDLKMSGMDGIETVQALRALDPELPVIVATGFASIETAVACMKNGAYDYIQKPYQIKELKRLLARAVEKSQLESVVALFAASRV